MVYWNDKIHRLTSSLHLVDENSTWPALCDLFLSQSPRKFYVSRYLGQILVCTKTFCQYRQILFLSLRFFRLLSSPLLLFPQRFGRYVLRPSSGVCRTREPSVCHNRVQVLSILVNYSPLVRIEPATFWWLSS